jgi:hypothetical protein
MSRAAVQAFEAGRRKASLDEVFALIDTLKATPPQLLSPLTGMVQLTSQLSADAAGMRLWLRFGDAALASGGDLPSEQVEHLRQQSALAHARALVDAEREGDKVGIQEAFRALRDTFVMEEKP